MTNMNMTTNDMREVISFIRPKTGKKYERIDGIWYLNGRPIPESGKGNRAAQWQIEGEYQASMNQRAEVGCGLFD